jgi:hypothetical protein
MKYILCIPHARDEATIKPQPTRHVDYLSHDWEEEDIWSSWKCFVSHRGEYRDSRRLENAMWRAWMKAKNKLKTVRPETLNWYVDFWYVFSGLGALGLILFLFRSKDNDLTWLYGPLQAGGGTNATIDVDQHPLVSSSIEKKTILKKRRIAERILEGSYAGVVTPSREEDGQGIIARTTSGYSLIRDRGGVPSSTAYGISSSRRKRKHVHFSGQVEQLVIGVEGDGPP